MLGIGILAIYTNWIFYYRRLKSFAALLKQISFGIIYCTDFPFDIQRAKLIYFRYTVDVFAFQHLRLLVLCTRARLKDQRNYSENLRHNLRLISTMNDDLPLTPSETPDSIQIELPKRSHRHTAATKNGMGLRCP